MNYRVAYKMLLNSVSTKSGQVHIVLALVRAQKAMGSNWCTVWELTESVLSDKSLKQDLRKEAKKIIIDYMILYKDECR